MQENGKKPNPNLFSKEKQPSNEAKMVKKSKTIIKESIGLTSWESIQSYLTGEGAEKFIKEIKKMEGKEYSINYLAAMEYFKPKLARTEHTGKDGDNEIVVRFIDA